MMKLFFLLCFLFLNTALSAHDGELGQPTTWIEWIGSFHLILVHFPIALINMVAVSEVLRIWYRELIFEYASRFMLISAAIIAPPTAFLGWIYSYFGTYDGIMGTFLFWHMWLGITTAALTVFLAITREESKLYYYGLVLLVLLTNLTGFFGGGMVFGPYHMNLPL